MIRLFSIFSGAAVIALALSSSVSISAKGSPPAKISSAAKQKEPHRLVVKVDVNDPAVMNLELNNLGTAAQFYSAAGQKIENGVVAFGPGLHMLRDDASQVKARIKSMSETMPQLRFSACGNSREN